MIWLIRMSQWLRNPPSLGRVKLYAAVVGLAVLIGALEFYGLWPAWASLEHAPRRIGY